MLHTVINKAPLIFLLILANPISACDSEIWFDKIEDWFMDSSIAFEGEILTVNYLGESDSTITIDQHGDKLSTIIFDTNGYDLYEVRVIRDFKNQQLDSIIHIRTDARSSCSPFFQSHKRYIIFASRPDEYALYIDICYGSTISTNENLQIIEKLIK